MSNIASIVRDSLRYKDKNYEINKILFNKFKYYKMIDNKNDLAHCSIQFYDKNKKSHYKNRNIIKRAQLHDPLAFQILIIKPRIHGVT